ncbi:hypothetical protein NESM_000788700 [Novymonas esmeraldas]|uniref:Uncharacterized protein n=1 Tax=Novymonas esmeraldas TaxID=1808958 RepID=A0AAW0EX19_9TRYP
MAVVVNKAFAGYAYYSTGGEGFIYTLISKQSPTAVGAPVVVVDGTARANNFFPFLFLVAGGALLLVLFVCVSAAFCCRRTVAKLEEEYWKLQYAFADVNDTLVREASRRPSAKAAASKPKRAPSQSSMGADATSQSPAPQARMQQQGSTASMSSMRQPQRMAAPQQPPPPPPQQQQAAYPAYSVSPAPWGGAAYPAQSQPVSPPLMQYAPPPPPPPQQQQQQSYGEPAANPYYSQPGAGGGYNYSYDNSYTQAAPTSAVQQTRVSGGSVAPQSPAATPDQPLRRRESKVSFVGA